MLVKRLESKEAAAAAVGFDAAAVGTDVTAAGADTAAVDATADVTSA